MRREVQDIQHWMGSRMITTYRVIVEVGVDINTRSEFNVRVGVKVEVEWRLKQKSSRSSEYQSCQGWSRLIKVVKVGSSWSRLIFELRKYNINYLFKYWKSVAESGSIVIMVPS